MEKAYHFLDNNGYFLLGLDHWSCGRIVLIKDRRKVNGTACQKKFRFYKIFEKDLSGDCVRKLGLNGLKRVNKGFSRIVNMNRKILTLKRNT